MNEIIDLYERYVEKLEDIVYNTIAVKLATFKGFDEMLKQDNETMFNTFPLLGLVTESLQVDNVITICKLLEVNPDGKTLIRFVNFTKVNYTTLKKRYPKLTKQTIEQDLYDFASLEQTANRIKTQRDKYYAHSDNEYFFVPEKITHDFPNTYNDLSNILTTFQRIISRHSLIIKGNSRVCISDFVYVNSYQTLEILKKAKVEFKNTKNDLTIDSEL